MASFKGAKSEILIYSEPFHRTWRCAPATVFLVVMLTPGISQSQPRSQCGTEGMYIRNLIPEYWNQKDK
jgi:hypothetical protein